MNAASAVRDRNGPHRSSAETTELLLNPGRVKGAINRLGEIRNSGGPSARPDLEEHSGPRCPRVDKREVTLAGLTAIVPAGIRPLLAWRNGCLRPVGRADVPRFVPRRGDEHARARTRSWQRSLRPL